METHRLRGRSKDERNGDSVSNPTIRLTLWDPESLDTRIFTCNRDLTRELREFQLLFSEPQNVHL
jgi:hypothetical protein